MSIAEKLISTIHSSPAIVRSREHLAHERLVHIKGAMGGLKSLVLADLFKELHSQIIFFTPDPVEVEGIHEDLALLLGDESVAYFPASNYTGGIHLSSHGVLGPRLNTLEILAGGEAKVVITHQSGLEPTLPAAPKFQREKITLALNDALDFQELISDLIDLGFTRESRVENPGEMSVRGGIVDVFPFSSEFPFRIEFWGDEVESIRKFDPVDQRAIGEVKGLKIFQQQFDAPDEEATPQNASLLDYLKPDAVVVLDEPEIIHKNFKLEKNRDDDPEWEQLQEAVWSKIMRQADEFRQVRFVSLGMQYANLVDLNAKAQDSFKGSLKLFRQTIEKLNSGKSNGRKTVPAIYYVCDNAGQAARVDEIFADENITAPNLTVAALGLHRGFVFPDGNLVVYTDHQFYGRSKRLRLPKGSRKGLTPKQLRRLNIGDFVVHVDYGVGVFLGLKKVTVRGHERECLHLEYKDKDKVYVRVERMDRVHKFSSKDGATPALNKLGSPDWQRLKERTKKKLKEMAKDLIEIYAKRKSQPGIQFAADTLWQRELEASFPYDDTPDQVKATRDVKADMENPQPMDRLVCGDVGFGKTEIAVRAAFKAVLSDKQVAMLVPTTILAHQHYNTFRERLERFPVNVEMLSRFRTATEQKRIVKRIKTGEIDIVIGTHRLLSKDVEFKKLGLIVIDEEQRFGVRHKERLKRFRATVDVLTLTATPIPRTLQFSLMGARDMTNIDTPPKNRLPIITEILTLNKHYIREVILRELDRGGQVFFVHNRVRSINRVGKMISDLVPEADVAIAHGQMKERELEKVIIDFMQEKYQILVCTMIIESGMDMPNVNTIIINRADKLGLAQLYQLRGRVGRSHHRAYAYLLIPPIETMTDVALKRLRAIEEFSELGSGRQLAMRDLEIRGAGNLLGAEQKGFINSIGFEMYHKVLDEAVKELKQETVPDGKPKVELETQVEMDCDAFLPEQYIESGSERVDIYRRLMESETTDELDEIRSELQDRFGRLPGPVDNLLNFIAIRVLGPQLGFKSVRITDDEMVAEFATDLLELAGEPFKKWLGSMVENATQPVEFFQNEGLGIRVRIENKGGNKLLLIKDFCQKLATNTEIELKQKPFAEEVVD